MSTVLFILACIAAWAVYWIGKYYKSKTLTNYEEYDDDKVRKKVKK